MLCTSSSMGNHHARESGEEECELFGDILPGQEEIFPEEPPQHEAHQDELDRASIPSASNAIASNLTGPRCINGELARPTPPSDDSPSTAFQASTACAPGGVRLGKASPPCFGSPPGIFPSRRIPPPPPPPAEPRRAAHLLSIKCLIQCSGHLSIPDPRVQEEEEEVHPKVQEEEEQAREQATRLIHPAMHTQEEGEQVPISQEEESHHEEDPLAAIQVVAVPIHLHRHLQVLHLRSHQEEQVIQAALHRLHLQQHLQRTEQSTRGHH